MPSKPSRPTVAVVMCTYNGCQHLKAQLDSLLAQTWPISVHAFDDQSTDETVALLETYSEKLTIMVSVNPQNMGYSANFEAGIKKVLSDGFDYIALCDQDDIWAKDRVATGMQHLLAVESDKGHRTPVLVHSDLSMIDSLDRPIHQSFLRYRGYTIGNKNPLASVLGQNGVMGNTILMNSALASLAQPFPVELHVHDYWLAVLAQLHGHRELLDVALVSYRIHDSNASNSNDSIKFGLARLLDGKSWRGFVKRDYRLPFKEDSRLNVINTLLSSSTKYPELTVEQKDLLYTFKAYLDFEQSRLSLLVLMMRAGFFRKGFIHRMRLIYSILLTKRY